MILALEYHRSPGRYLTARGLTATRTGHRASGMIAGNLSPLRLVNRPSPELPGPGWTRVSPRLSGICGSDLALLTGRSSPYLSPVTSMPFVPGHEVVGETMDEMDGLPRGTRVVLDPVLSCAAREMTPPCRWCAAGEQNRCDHITSGGISPGLQTGFCGDTGGGWSWEFVAHQSQLHPVPDSLPDTRAVLVEPLACAIHSVRRAAVPAGASVVIVGAGTVGLFTLLALRELTAAGPVYVVAKHGHQQARAKALDATGIIDPDRAARSLRRATAARLHTPERGADFLLGGVDVAFECTGGGAGLDTALRLTRAGGTVVVSGMPSGGVDLTPLWYRELRLIGAYASASGGGETPGAGAETAGAGAATASRAAETARDGTDSGGAETARDRTQTASRAAETARAGDFAGSMQLAGSPALDGYVDTRYPLGRWRDALNHAAAAGRLGTVKVAFDLTRR